MESTGVAFELLTFWSHIWFHFKCRRNSVAKIRKLKDAGFIDAWTIKGKAIGFTYCQDEDLLNSSSSLTVRTDMVMSEAILRLKI